MLRSPIETPIMSPVMPLFGRNGAFTAGFQSEVIPPGMTFTRASAGYTHNKSGILVPVANNEPKFDYHPGTLANLGLLLEPARNCYIRRSEEFTNGTWWTANQSTIAADQTVAPDGNNTGDLWKESNANNVHNMSQLLAALSANQTFTVWVFAKPVGAKDRLVIQLVDNTSSGNNAGIIFNTSTGAAVSNIENGTGTAAVAAATSIAYPNGWRRYRATITPTTAGNTGVLIRIGSASNGGTTLSFTGDVNDGFYLWGAQMENNVNGYSYVKTLDSVVTTTNDLLGGAFPAFFNTNAGTMFYHGSMPRLTNTSFPVLYNLDDGSANNRHTLFFTNLVPAFGYAAFNGGVSQLSCVGAATIAEHQAVKFAGAYAPNDGIGCQDGVLTAQDTSVSLPTGINAQTVGRTSVAGLGGIHVREVRYYPRRLADLELQQLTA